MTDNALRRHALPEFITEFDIGIELGADTDYLLLTLHTFLLGGGGAPDAIDRVAKTALRFPRSARWLEVRATCVEDVDEATPPIVERLRGTFPTGDAGLWYLSWCNAVCRKGPAFVHPYDTSDGAKSTL